jgi:MFS family permease
MDGVGNLEGWRWIFILEGILTVVVAVIAFFVLYDFPETASFLTEEERAFVVWRLKYQGNKEGAEVLVAQDDTFKWKYVKDAFLDWQIWTNIWVYWGELWTTVLDYVKRPTDSVRYCRTFIRHLAIPANNYQKSGMYQFVGASSHLLIYTRGILAPLPNF